MSLRLYTGAAAKSSAPIAAAFSSTVPKISSRNASTSSRHVMNPSCQRCVYASTALRQYTSPNKKWSRASWSLTRQRRFQSTSPNNGSPHRSNSKGSTFSTLSTLSNIFAAGTGTFASTLLALYLATVVETSAHETLYEYCPYKYYEVAEEDLPNCLKTKELARRAHGIVESNRTRGVAEEGRDCNLMGMDGWMETSSGLNKGGKRIMDAELLAEVNFERQHANKEVVTLSAWQRRMTEKRASIIEEEEKDFSRGITKTSAPPAVSKSNKRGSLEMEARKIQEEATKKLQEQLMSLAMTA